MRAVALMACAVLGCREPEGEGPADARGAMSQWSRCAFDGLGGAPGPGEVEGAMRRALRSDRARWVVRAGRCEDLLAVRGRTPACLEGLRARWAAMLPVAQRATEDAIELDVAVRRVGEAWRAARAGCP